MRFALECYECKWSTVVADDYLEGWVKRHAEDDPTHSVTVRLVPEVAPEPDGRVEALEKRLTDYLIRMNKMALQLERFERAQQLLLDARPRT